MATTDFIFTYATGATTLEPVEVLNSADGFFGVPTWVGIQTAKVVEFVVSYPGDVALTDPGFYIQPSSNTLPGEFNTRVATPYNAYQTILSAGSEANDDIVAGSDFEDVAAGIIVQINDDDPVILRWGYGDSPNTKVVFAETLSPGQTFSLTVGWLFRTTPDSVDPDLMLVDLVFE